MSRIDRPRGRRRLEQVAVDLDRLPDDRRPTPTFTAADIAGRVLHLDPSVIVLDKPPGLSVHPGPSSPDHLERYLDALAFGAAGRPQLAHRLDRDTSGCLALGRHRKALRRLGALFQAGRVGKTYWAVVDGVPDAPEGLVDAPILKVNDRRGWRMVVDERGRSALTGWRVLASDGRLAWLELTPRTGRTHQLRVHAALMGWAILGDGFYARDGARQGPLHLHARSLTLPLDAARPLHVEAPPPPHLVAAITTLGGHLPASLPAPSPTR